MRSLAVLLSGVLLCTACGEDSPAPPTGEESVSKDELLQQLFEAPGAEELQKAIAAARAGGVSDQAVLEARFLALVDAGDNAGIGKLAAELEAAAPDFNTSESAIFSQKEEFLAIIEYARALAALDKGDREGFKKHIKEAFWLSPNQGAAFAPHIERLRLDEAMAKLKIDFERPLANQNSGQPTTLAQATGESTHVLLHFWSPWSEECAVFLDDFIATSVELEKNGIAVVSLLSEPAPEALPDAKAFATKAAAGAKGHWLLDHPKTPFAAELRIMNVPTVTLIHRDGSVLFNGHPAEEGLWIQLKKAVPAIERPELAPADDLPDAP